MIGSLLAGTTETPGNVIKGQDGKLYKVYRGSASYGQKKELGNVRHIEGEETLVEYKGTAAKVMNKLIDGIRSGFSYGGALNLRQFQEKAQLIEISSAAFNESKPHLLNT